MTVPELVGEESALLPTPQKGKRASTALRSSPKSQAAEDGDENASLLQAMNFDIDIYLHEEREERSGSRYYANCRLCGKKVFCRRLAVVSHKKSCSGTPKEERDYFSDLSARLKANKAGNNPIKLPTRNPSAGYVITRTVHVKTTSSSVNSPSATKPSSSSSSKPRRRVIKRHKAKRKRSRRSWDDDDDEDDETEEESFSEDDYDEDEETYVEEPEELEEPDYEDEDYGAEDTVYSQTQQQPRKRGRPRKNSSANNNPPQPVLSNSAAGLLPPLSIDPNDPDHTQIQTQIDQLYQAVTQLVSGATTPVLDHSEQQLYDLQRSYTLLSTPDSAAKK